MNFGVIIFGIIATGVILLMSVGPVVDILTLNKNNIEKRDFNE